MKISLVIFALLAVAHNLTMPPRAASVNGTLISLDDLASGLVGHDDKWTMVLYNAHKTGGQCGGTSTKTSGDSDKCVDIKDKKCVDLCVNPNAGIDYCGFSFKSESNSGPQKQYEVVKGGSDSNGVDLKDDIKFVCVSCKLYPGEHSPLSDLR